MRKHFLSDFDFSILFVTILICIIGLFNLYSATHGGIIGAQKFSSQLTWMGVGFVVLIISTLVDYRIIERFVYPIFGFLIFLLILVLIFGTVEHGSRRWLNLGGPRIQPSEFMKLGIVLCLAKYFHEERKLRGYGLRDLMIPFGLLMIPMFLILVEPDLGTALMIGLIGFSMFLFIKMKLKSFLIIATIGFITVPIAWQFVLKGYQKERVLTFLNPERDPRGKGFHALQSRIAIGSGQFLGKGYRKGTQTQLNFLPEQRTDFIFSVFAEEHGFKGSVLLIGLYLWFLSLGMRASRRAKDKFGALLAYGITTIFFWQIFVNIGMVTGLLPIVGVTLPFMSYGGSSILTSLILVGLLINISMRRYMF
ncbi:MAG: rod shape-determining protein RodA [Deltaproteobacteria bacterium]|nr:rod shape-determining protein RodA [Deltaproteobacteria bacterium]